MGLTLDALNDKTVTELYEIARICNIPSYRKLKKDALIKAISEYSNSQETVTPEPVVEVIEKKEEEYKPVKKHKNDKRHENKVKEQNDQLDIQEEKKEINSSDKPTIIYAQGILEVLPEGYGFLRVKGYLPSTEDIYVSQTRDIISNRLWHITKKKRNVAGKAGQHSTKKWRQIRLLLKPDKLHTSINQMPSTMRL